MSEIIAFYDLVDEEQRFIRNSRKIEFITSIKALEQYITEPTSILELGAGTGAYSFYFANRGFDVTALDIVPSNVEKMNHKKSESSNQLSLNIMLGDACDLSNLADQSFEHVLCLGPYYHIINPDDRRKLIEESLRVLRPGGTLAIAYMSKYSIMPMLIKKMNEFVRQETIQKVMVDGYIKAGDKDAFWTNSHYTTPDEIESYMSQFDVTIEDHLATDGLSHTISDEVDQLSEEQFSLYCDYHQGTCRDRSILGISTHGLLICKKR